MNHEEDMDQLSLAESVLKDNFDLIRHADHKAQCLLRISLAIFAAAFIGVPPTMMALKDFISDGGWKFVLFGAVVLLYVLCATSLLVSIVKIVGVIRPRRTDDVGPGSALFFDSVARGGLDGFRLMMQHMNYQRASDERAKQAFYSAVIAQRKYHVLNEAISWMLGGGLVGVVFALILLVSVGWL
jgi:hypothetical protein